MRGTTLNVTYAFSPNTLISSTEMNTNFSDTEDVVNALQNDNIAADAAIVDTKLAQITTASKIHGTALTGLASIPVGAGEIPSANIPAISAADFKTGDWIISSVATARTGWTDVSTTYANKFMRVSATPLSTGGADTFTLAETNLPAHTHTGPSHTHGVGTLAMTAHTHSVYSVNASSSGSYQGFTGSIPVEGSKALVSTAVSSSATPAITGAMAADGTGVTSSVGSGTAVSNVPVYVTVCIFQKD